MALRKASVYKNIERPYTRKSRVKGKDYVKSIPPKHIVKFSMGDVVKFEKGQFNYIIKLVAGIDMQLRDNAIEAVRQLVHRHFEAAFGTNYYLAVAVYPHHVIREHKMAAVAQSDRIFAGMSHAFGKPISVAAQVHKGKDILLAAVDTDDNVREVRKIFHMARSKIGSDVSVVVEKVQK